MGLVSPTAVAPPDGIVEKRKLVTVGTQAPLTTQWAAPASCDAAIPTLSAGACNTASCTAHPASSVAKLFSAYGASVNYPGFTTSQFQTSTSCMPSGYANLQWFYFTGGSQCPSNWATATSTNDRTLGTIVCCPTRYPTAKLNAGGNFDCYTKSSITAGQPFILAAQGKIATSQDGPSVWVPYWTSQSIITTTAWPTPTTATLYHPGVNFLVEAPSAAATTSSGDSSSPSGSSDFSLWNLSMGASIGIVVAFAIAAIVGIACCIGLVLSLFGGKRRQQPPTAGTYYPPPPAAQDEAPPPGPYPSPPPVVQYDAPPPRPYPPPPPVAQCDAPPLGHYAPPAQDHPPSYSSLPPVYQYHNKGGDV